MSIDYARISEANTTRYGTDIDEYGPTLLANLYSDRTHFIYELIQNAEDAGATRIEFQLFAYRLEVRHNGRPFTDDDVRGICGLAKGTKKDDLTQIGKFGIGFKSVYAYTTRPHVYSGNEAFCIRNYVHPEAALSDTSMKEETLFVLPFDHATVTSAEAFAEISGRLRDLGPRLLLFIRHLEEIHWSAQGQDRGCYIRKSDITDAQYRHVHVRAGVEGNTGQEEEWLVFSRPLTQQALRVEVAYQLAPGKDESVRSVIPTHGATLVAFFATDRETHLNFLIQGPYRTTPARDNIPERDPWNKMLIRETATLIADSISLMKEMGYLTVDFLSILPISTNDFPETFMLRPLYEAVRTKISGPELLLPAADGGYANAHSAYLARGQGLTTLLDSEHLMLLFGRSGTWLSTDITYNRTPVLRSFLMSELGVPEIDAERFARQLNLAFLTSQDDNWIIELYRYLNSMDRSTLLKKPQVRSQYGRRVKTEEGGVLCERPIIRLSDNTHVIPFTEQGEPTAYLPGDFTSSASTVKRSISSDEDARAFLGSLGFEEFDIYAEVMEHILPKYEQAKMNVEYHEGREDNRKIARALSIASKSKRDDLILKLRNLPFLTGHMGSTSESFPCYLGKRVYLSKDYTGDRELEEFLTHIGVAEEVVWLDAVYKGIYSLEQLTEVGCISQLDEVTEVNWHILRKYVYSSVSISDEDALRDATVVYETLRDIGSQQKRSDFEAKLRGVSFLRAVDAETGTHQCHIPANIYLGAWYTGNENIDQYFQGNVAVFFLADFYRQRLSVEELESLGCLSEIKVSYRKPGHMGYVFVTRGHGNHARGLDGFDPNFHVEGLSHAVETIATTGSVILAKFIWQLVQPYRQTIYGTVETSTTQNFAVNRKEEARASKAGQILREGRWLPDKYGQFHIPSEIRLSDLHEILETEDPAAKELATKLGLMPEIDLSPLAPEDRAKFEFALNLSDDEFQALKKQTEKTRAARLKEAQATDGPKFQQKIREVFDQPRTSIPEELQPSSTLAAMPDLERRRDRIREQISEDIQSEPATERRYHRVFSKRWESKDGYVRTSLNEHYQGHCQICGYAFRKRDGEPYFEGLYLVSRTKGGWIDRPGNVLCLCANCCAKFLYGEVEVEGDIVEQLLAAQVGSNGSGSTITLKFRLCGEEVRLTFRDRHILDLQEMLRADQIPDHSE